MHDEDAQEPVKPPVTGSVDRGTVEQQAIQVVLDEVADWFQFERYDRETLRSDVAEPLVGLLADAGLLRGDSNEIRALLAASAPPEAEELEATPVAATP